MGKVVQIRNVPDDIHRTLRSRAADAGLSLSDYLLAEIVRVAERPRIADALARATSRSAGVASEAIVEAVRAGRDR